MTELELLTIEQTNSTATIQLMLGDLAAIPPERATDILVMSAFPGNYTALQGSLVKALLEKGLSIASLAKNKETDLLSSLHCWLSKPLTTQLQQQLNFKKVLCFEPGPGIKSPHEVVGDIFRCINSFAFEEDNNEIAMPMIGTGYQGVSLDEMLPALLDASYFWLSNGLPLKNIKLVVHSKADVAPALELFRHFKRRMCKPANDNPPRKNTNTPAVPNRYDYFLSYAHVHAKDIARFVTKLTATHPNIRLFYDKESIPPGGMWIQQISNAIQQSGKVLVFLSPDYDRSPVCWDEFQCAKLLEYNSKKPVIQTVYLYGHKENPMPLIMGIYSYIDCREGDIAKLEQEMDTLQSRTG